MADQTSLSEFLPYSYEQKAKPSGISVPEIKLALTLSMEQQQQQAQQQQQTPSGKALSFWQVADRFFNQAIGKVTDNKITEKDRQQAEESVKKACAFWKNTFGVNPISPQAQPNSDEKMWKLKVYLRRKHANVVDTQPRKRIKPNNVLTHVVKSEFAITADCIGALQQQSPRKPLTLGALPAGFFVYTCGSCKVLDFSPALKKQCENKLQETKLQAKFEQDMSALGVDASKFTSKITQVVKLYAGDRAAIYAKLQLILTKTLPEEREAALTWLLDTSLDNQASDTKPLDNPVFYEKLRDGTLQFFSPKMYQNPQHQILWKDIQFYMPDTVLEQKNCLQRYKALLEEQFLYYFSRKAIRNANAEECARLAHSVNKTLGGWIQTVDQAIRSSNNKSKVQQNICVCFYHYMARALLQQPMWLSVGLPEHSLSHQKEVAYHLQQVHEILARGGESTPVALLGCLESSELNPDIGVHPVARALIFRLMAEQVKCASTNDLSGDELTKCITDKFGAYEDFPIQVLSWCKDESDDIYFAINEVVKVHGQVEPEVSDLFKLARGFYQLEESWSWKTEWRGESPYRFQVNREGSEKIKVKQLSKKLYADLLLVLAQHELSIDAAALEQISRLLKPIEKSLADGDAHPPQKLQIATLNKWIKQLQPLKVRSDNRLSVKSLVNRLIDTPQQELKQSDLQATPRNLGNLKNSLKLPRVLRLGALYADQAIVVDVAKCIPEGKALCPGNLTEVESTPIIRAVLEKISGQRLKKAHLEIGLAASYEVALLLSKCPDLNKAAFIKCINVAKDPLAMMVAVKACLNKSPFHPVVVNQLMRNASIFTRALQAYNILMQEETSSKRIKPAIQLASKLAALNTNGERDFAQLLHALEDCYPKFRTPFNKDRDPKFTPTDVINRLLDQVFNLPSVGNTSVAKAVATHLTKMSELMRHVLSHQVLGRFALECESYLEGKLREPAATRRIFQRLWQRFPFAKLDRALTLYKKFKSLNHRYEFAGALVALSDVVAKHVKQPEQAMSLMSKFLDKDYGWWKEHLNAINSLSIDGAHRLNNRVYGRNFTGANYIPAQIELVAEAKSQPYLMHLIEKFFKENHQPDIEAVKRDYWETVVAPRLKQARTAIFWPTRKTILKFDAKLEQVLEHPLQGKKSLFSNVAIQLQNSYRQYLMYLRKINVSADFNISIEIKLLVQSITQTLPHHEKMARCCKLLALISHGLAIEKGYYPRPTQMVPILTAVRDYCYGTTYTHLMQINTGEGKSLISAVMAAFNAATGHAHATLTSDDRLAEEERRKYKRFFDRLGIQTALLKKPDAAYAMAPGVVVYTTYANFQLNYRQACFDNKAELEPIKLSINADEADTRTLDNLGVSIQLALPLPGEAREPEASRYRALFCSLARYANQDPKFGQRKIPTELKQARAYLKAELNDKVYKFSIFTDDTALTQHLDALLRARDLYKAYQSGRKYYEIVPSLSTFRRELTPYLANGQLAHRQQFSEGVHQALVACHIVNQAVSTDLPLHCPVLTEVVRRDKAWTLLDRVRGAGRCFCLSGTMVGNQAELAFTKAACECAPTLEGKPQVAARILTIPPFKRSKRVDEPAVLCANAAAKKSALFRMLTKHINKNPVGPVLIEANTADEAVTLQQAFVKYLQQHNQRKVRVLLDTALTTELHSVCEQSCQVRRLMPQHFLRQAAELQTISFTTKKNTRGFDIVPPTDPRTAKEIVPLTFISLLDLPKLRDNIQGKGRAGRKGEVGYTYHFVDKSVVNKKAVALGLNPVDNHKGYAQLLRRLDQLEAKQNPMRVFHLLSARLNNFLHDKLIGKFTQASSVAFNKQFSEIEARFQSECRTKMIRQAEGTQPDEQLRRFTDLAQQFVTELVRCFESPGWQGKFAKQWQVALQDFFKRVNFALPPMVVKVEEHKRQPHSPRPPLLSQDSDYEIQPITSNDRPILPRYGTNKFCQDASDLVRLIKDSLTVTGLSRRNATYVSIYHKATELKLQLEKNQGVWPQSAGAELNAAVGRMIKHIKPRLDDPNAVSATITQSNMLDAFWQFVKSLIGVFSLGFLASSRATKIRREAYTLQKIIKAQRPQSDRSQP